MKPVNLAKMVPTLQSNLFIGLYCPYCSINPQSIFLQSALCPIQQATKESRSSVRDLRQIKETKISLETRQTKTDMLTGQVMDLVSTGDFE